MESSEVGTPPAKVPPARAKVHVPKLALPPAIGSPVALPLAQLSPSADSGSEISITSLQVRSCYSQVLWQNGITKCDPAGR